RWCRRCVPGWRSRWSKKTSDPRLRTKKARLRAGLFRGAAGRSVLVADAGHAEDVVPRIDVGDFAGDARGQVRTQERGGVADVLDGDAAAQRRVLFEMAEHLAEVRDTGGRQGLDWAGGNRVDAGALRAEVQREIAHRRLEAGLGHAHHVVVLQRALGAQV